MRCKFYLSIFLALTVSVIFSVSAVSQNPEKSPSQFSDLIEVKNTITYPRDLTFKRPPQAMKTNFAPAKFSHSGGHTSVACQTCHHAWDGVGKVDSCASPGCHDNFSQRYEPVSYFKAFHSRKAENSCLGCHIKINAELKAAGKPLLKISGCAQNICHVAPKVQ